MSTHCFRWTGWLCLVFATWVNAEEIVIKPRQSTPPLPVTPPSRPEPQIPKTSPAKPGADGIETIVQVDILSPGILGDPSAQNWGKVFDDLGISVRIRNGREVTSGVTEKSRGSLRFVTAAGLLNRDGQLNFGVRSFKLSETEPLQQWINELKVYGAQGAPEGQVLWGLNQAQFQVVEEQMRQPLTVETQGQKLTALTTSLQKDAHLPIRLAAITETWLKDSSNDRTLSRHVSGFSTGTGLAIVLNEIGAGFRPVRTPAGKVEFQILPLDEMTDAWPMGWEPEETTPRNLITPELFKMGTVGFEESPLVDVLAAIETESKTPIIIDHRKIEARKIDLSKITASSPPKRSAWAIVVSQSVRKAGLHNSYRQDEAGLGFIVVTPYEPKVVKPR